MDLAATEEQQALLETVRRFVQTKVVPAEEDLPVDAPRLRPETERELKGIVAQMGLTCWDAPEEVGGPGLDVVTRTLLSMEMSQHRAGLYTPCYGVFGSAGLAQLYDATEEQKQRYLYPTMRGERKGFFALTEASGGSDPARSVQTKAVREGDEWVLDGTKMWISSVMEADYGIVVARTGEGRQGLTSFILDKDTPGLEVQRVIPTLRRVVEPTELVLRGVRLPDENRLGPVGGGFGLASRRLAQARIPYAANCVGVAIAAHRLATEYAGIRDVFGKPLARHQGVQWMLVDNELDIRSARLLVLEAASIADRGGDFKAAASAAKIVCSEAGSRVVDRSMQIHGGLGMAAELPFERWYREMRIRRIGEGPTEVHRMVLARELLGDVASVSGAGG